MSAATIVSPVTASRKSAGAETAFRFAARTAGLKPSAIREILKVTESPEIISFAGGLPAPELFPLETLAHAAATLFATEGAAALQYSTTEGYPPLREWVCGHLRKTVGLAATPDQVLITHGSQQGLDLVAKVLLDPGDIVLVENPAYLGALQVFQAYEAHVIGVPADEHGLRSDALRELLRTSPRRPKLLYLIPNFQNPSGTSLAATRRAEIVGLAAEFGVPLLEDDPYGELRYSGQPSPALGALPGARDCLYLGTASKILAPGLRVAWLVAPNHRVYEQLVTAKQAADLHTSTFAQRLLGQCLRQPDFLSTHVARLCTVYAERRDAMLAALEKHLPDGCTWTQPDGGLFLWVTLPAHLDTTPLLRVAAAAHVAFVPGASFWVGPPRHNTMRLNFSNASTDRIEAGIARLGQVIAAA